MSEFIIDQLSVNGFDDNFSYVVVNLTTKKGFVVDPAGDELLIIDKVKKYITEKNIDFDAVLITHGHGDHSEKATQIVNFFQEYCKHVSIVVHENSSKKFDNCDAIIEKVTDGVKFYDLGVEVLFTPGHTNDAVCYLLDDKSAVFTGDTLFVDDIGFCEETDMFNSLRTKLWNLPDNCIVYSGHDYGHVKYCSIAEAKQKNLFFRACSKSFADFKEQLKKLI